MLHVGNASSVCTQAVVDPAWDPTAKSDEAKSTAASDTRLDAIDLEQIACDHCGYMHKRGDGKSALGTVKFRERFFVLRDSKLLYYKTGAQALGDSATGSIDLREVHEVRPSKDPSSPDLAIVSLLLRQQSVVAPHSPSFGNQRDHLYPSSM